MTKETMEKKSPKNIQKAANWTLFVAFAVLVFAGVGFYYMKSEDVINAEILEGVQKTEAINTTSATTDKSTIDAEKEVKDLDNLINGTSEGDFSNSQLDDTNLSL
jgi:hypothetical protein